MNSEDKFNKKVACIFLKKRLKLNQPTQDQINEMANILSYVWLRRALLFDERLTNQERLCLTFAAQGNTSEETAELLDISAGTVRTHERAITKKLSCKNMKQAVAVGIRYAVGK